MSTSQQGPNATEFAVIICKAHFQRPVQEVWPVIGSFREAGKFLNVPCELVSDLRGIGCVRKVGDSILEVMVGETTHSYSYAQIAGPMAHLAYHGCVSLGSGDATSCELTYSITYDQISLSEAEKDIQAARLRQRFQGAVEAMKSAVDGAGH